MTRYVVVCQIQMGSVPVRHWLTFEMPLGARFTPTETEASETQSEERARGWLTWCKVHRAHVKPRLARRTVSGEKERDE